MRLLLAITLAAGLMEVLVLEPSVDKQMKQFDDVAKDSRAMTDRYLDRHQRDEEINALHDIEDAIIFDSIEEGDD